MQLGAKFDFFSTRRNYPTRQVSLDRCTTRSGKIIISHFVKKKNYFEKKNH